MEAGSGPDQEDAAGVLQPLGGPGRRIVGEEAGQLPRLALQRPQEISAWFLALAHSGSVGPCVSPVRAFNTS